MSGDTATPLKATVLSERSQSWDTTSDHVGMSSAGRSNEAAQTYCCRDWRKVEQGDGLCFKVSFAVVRTREQGGLSCCGSPSSSLSFTFRLVNFK